MSPPRPTRVPVPPTLPGENRIHGALAESWRAGYSAGWSSAVVSLQRVVLSGEIGDVIRWLNESLPPQENAR